MGDDEGDGERIRFDDGVDSRVADCIDACDWWRGDEDMMAGELDGD
jgi:hypothetical protein